jgi:hypothetical protein
MLWILSKIFDLTADAEVAEVLRSLTSNPSVLKALIGLQFPGVISNIPFVKFFIKAKANF